MKRKENPLECTRKVKRKQQETLDHWICTTQRVGSKNKIARLTKPKSVSKFSPCSNESRGKWWKWKEVVAWPSQRSYVDRVLKLHDGLFFHAAGIVPLTVVEGSLCLLMARSQKNTHTFLGGKREPGEWVKDTAEREFWEETGGIVERSSIRECLSRAWLRVWCADSKYAMFVCGVECGGHGSEIPTRYLEKTRQFGHTERIITPYESLVWVPLARFSDIPLHPFVDHIRRTTDFLNVLRSMDIIHRRGQNILTGSLRLATIETI
jgi:8-oxo-dGTP pyrophosphatase MutT (NUDIX family)